MRHKRNDGSVMGNARVGFLASFIIAVASTIGGIIYCASGPQDKATEHLKLKRGRLSQDLQQTRESPSGEQTQDATTVRDPTPSSEERRADNPPPGSKLWFVRPDLEADLRFRSVPTTPANWDASCATHPFFGKSDLETIAKDELNFDPADYFVAGTLPVQFAQFWRAGTEYRQFSFRWEQNTPQTFQTEIYASDDPLMSRNVRPLALDGMNAAYGQLYSDIKGYLRRTLPGMLADGPLQAGARVGLFRAAARPALPESQQAYYLVDLRNAQIVSLSGEGLTCAKSELAASAFCACTSSGMP